MVRSQSITAVAYLNRDGVGRSPKPVLHAGKDSDVGSKIFFPLLIDLFCNHLPL